MNIIKTLYYCSRHSAVMAGDGSCCETGDTSSSADATATCVCSTFQMCCSLAPSASSTSSHILFVHFVFDIDSNDEEETRAQGAEKLRLARMSWLSPVAGRMLQHRQSCAVMASLSPLPILSKSSNLQRIGFCRFSTLTYWEWQGGGEHCTCWLTHHRQLLQTGPDTPNFD